MNRKLLPILVLFTLAAGSFLSRAADEPANPATTEALIERLGSAQFEERVRAAEALRTRGTKVLPALHKAEKHTDLEVRRRLAELIPALEAIAAVESKRVTLRAEPQSLGAMLKAIEKQTGYTVEAEGPDDPKLYMLELKKAPFWEALEHLCRATGCRVMQDEEEMKFRLKRSPRPAPFVVNAASFRLELTRIHEERDSDFQKTGRDKELGERNSQMTLTVGVLPEPKYLILGINQPVVEKACDENEEAITVAIPDKSELKALLPPPPLGNQYVEKSHEPNQTDIRLHRAEAKGKTIKELRGSILVDVVVSRKDVLVTEKFLESKGTLFKSGSDTLQIVYADSENGHILVVKISTPDEVKKTWRARVHLEDAKGNRYTVDRVGKSYGGEVFSITYFYDKSDDPNFGPPVRVVVEDWTIQRHSIPFVFKDVPLP